MVAILPWYVELIIAVVVGAGGGDISFLSVLRIIRIFRVMRLFKMSKGSGSNGGGPHPVFPPWASGRLGARRRSPERRLRSLEPCRRLRISPQGCAQDEESPLSSAHHQARTCRA